MDNPKNAGMQKLTDKILRGGKREARKVLRQGHSHGTEKIENRKDWDRNVRYNTFRKDIRKAGKGKLVTNRYDPKAPGAKPHRVADVIDDLLHVNRKEDGGYDNELRDNLYKTRVYKKAIKRENKRNVEK